MKALEEDFTNIIRNNFKCDPSKMSELATEVKQFYFGDRVVGPDTANEFVDVSFWKIKYLLRKFYVD